MGREGLCPPLRRRRAKTRSSVVVVEHGPAAAAIFSPSPHAHGRLVLHVRIHKQPRDLELTNASSNPMQRACKPRAPPSHARSLTTHTHTTHDPCQPCQPARCWARLQRALQSPSAGPSLGTARWALGPFPRLAWRHAPSGLHRWDVVAGGKMAWVFGAQASGGDRPVATRATCGVWFSTASVANERQSERRMDGWREMGPLLARAVPFFRCAGAPHTPPESCAAGAVRIAVCRPDVLPQSPNPLGRIRPPAS